MSEELLFGVREDFSSLISAHCSKGSFDFLDFIATWNDLKFYYIFSGRQDVNEMKFFMDHILMIAKDYFLLSGNNDIKSASAIFLLHALYVNQPLTERSKIRIEKEELKLMYQFSTRMKAEGHKDIPFAFYSLVRKDAFHCVYTYWIRTPEKNIVDVREKLSIKEKLERNNLKINVTELLTKYGFGINNWNHIEALYNSEITEIKARDTKSEINQINSHNLIKFLESKSSSDPPVDPPVQKTRIVKPRFDELLRKGLPSTSKDPESEVAESSKSLPKIFYSSDEEDTPVPTPSDILMEEFNTSTSGTKIKSEVCDG